MATVISAYARVDGVGSSKFLHGLVLKLGLHAPVIVATNLVHLYCMSSCLGLARILFDEMIERNVVSWNVMLNGYVKGGWLIREGAV
ncbi:UNVERIFIED_CONTAM: Pentatricopeptide repeat-containing protein, mitochondrial [Sesamum radiatum]|uniref:Pentatricopeptide repeat-containing protein, mitochondrial n=1 Tax=Sesamum radiatum TaxID=300843 RepID=A0AAW2UCS6_SESRA